MAPFGLDRMLYQAFLDSASRSTSFLTNSMCPASILKDKKSLTCSMAPTVGLDFPEPFVLLLVTGPNKPSWSDSAIDTTFDKGDRRSCTTMAVKSASVFSARLRSSVYFLLEMGIHFCCGAIELSVLDGQSNLLCQGLEKLRLLGIKCVSSRAHQCKRTPECFGLTAEEPLAISFLRRPSSFLGPVPPQRLGQTTVPCSGYSSFKARS